MRVVVLWGPQSRIELARAIESLLRLGLPAFFSQRKSELVMRGGVFRIETYRLLEHLDRAVDVAAFHSLNSGVRREGRGLIVRFQLLQPRAFGEFDPRPRNIAFRAERIAERVADFGVLRREIDGLAELGDCGVCLAFLLQDRAERVVRLGEIRIDRDRLSERRYGLIEFPLLPVNHPQRVMSLLQGGLQSDAAFE